MLLFIDQDCVREFNNWTENATTSTAPTVTTTTTTTTVDDFSPTDYFNWRWVQDDHKVMLVWTFVVVGYLILLSPLAFVSIFFWIIAIEFGLETTLRSSLEDIDDDDLLGEDGNDDVVFETKTKTTTKSKKEQVQAAAASLSTTPSSSPTMMKTPALIRAEEAEGYEWPLGPF
jgi:hypothetical protein